MQLARTIRGASCAGALLFAGRSAHAEPESSRFVLAYEAPDGCPDRDTFVGAIRARTPRPQLAASNADAKAILLRVAISGKVGRSSGRLVLREPDGTEETRIVTSRTCGEVASALALVAAVMLDPEARVNASVVPPPAPSADTQEPSTEPAPPPSDTAPPGPPAVDASRAPPSTPPPSPPGPPKGARPPVSPRTEWRWSGGAEVGILGGMAPALAPVGGLFVDLERAIQAGLTSALRLSVDAGATISDLRAGTQLYEWLGATVRFCPAYVSLPGRLRLAPCGALQVAIHRSETRNVESPTTNVDLWLAPVVAGALDWRLTSLLTLELQGGAVFPVRRSRFFLAPASTFFEIPVVAPLAGVGIRLRFL